MSERQTVTIPRADILAIANRFGAVVNLDADLTADHVRGLADEFRRDASKVDGTDGHNLRLHGVRWRRVAGDVRVQADDLDALVDRIEREAGA